MTIKTNFQSSAYFLITLVLCVWILHVGSSVILPLIFASIFAIFLYPVDKKIIKLVKVRWISVVLSFFTIILPILIIGALFSYQLMNILESLPSIGNSLEKGVYSIARKVNDIIPIIDPKQLLSTEDQSFSEGPLGLLSQSIMSSTNLLLAIALTFIYTFFLLYYRRSFKNFIIYQFEKSARPDIRETLHSIKEMVQGYIGGLGLVVIILSILNTAGLWVIGVQYPLFWGSLAGFLAIIPYAGTLVGGLLPFIYTLATADHSWQPWAVVIYYLLIQQIEGNFITPKVVGDKVDINPLFAIISLIIFGSIMGVGGIVLALPLISIIKIILSNFDRTKPIAVLMSTDINSDPKIYKDLGK